MSAHRSGGVGAGASLGSRVMPLGVAMSVAMSVAMWMSLVIPMLGALVPARVQAAPPVPFAVAERATVPVTPVRVSRSAWYVQGLPGMVSSANQGYISNAGFVVTDDGVVVFDSLGSPALGVELIQAIQTVTDKPIRMVIVSHYHADHIYGLQPFKALGAEIVAHRAVLDFLKTDAPQARLAERRQSLFPWVNEDTRVLPPDRVIDAELGFSLGGKRFRLFGVGPAHTPEDLVMLLEDEGVLFVGDLMFAGRTPFVGDADSRAWLTALDRILAFKPRVMVGGHGGSTEQATVDIALTRDYLRFLRKSMGDAVEEGVDFEEAYKKTDWSAFSALPAFEAANRRNAYNTYLLMERESLGGSKGQ